MEAICIYCNAGYQEPEFVPAVDDDEAWTGLAEMHESNCEWILTRAHRLEECPECGEMHNPIESIDPGSKYCSNCLRAALPDYN